MRVIAGAVTPAAGAGASERVLEALVLGPGGPDGPPARTVSGPAAFLSTEGPEALEWTPWASAAGDLDLTNRRALEAEIDRPEGVGGLLTALFARHGDRLLERLRGAFALAIWDVRRARLLLAVDRFGIKRLYHAQTAEGLAFATRADALRRLAADRPDVDPTAIYHYLNLGFVPAPWSAHAGVRRLPPGHLLSFEGGRLRIAPYWDMRYVERRIPVREAARTVRAAVEDAVRETLGDGDVKTTGTFLSGGTDSSTVTGLLAAVTGERPSAFSIGFEEPGYSELAYAELAARRFGAAHYTHVLGADEALASVPALVEAYEEPFGNDSTLATLACARLARGCGMARLLAGDGGDELFGGNERYRTDRIFALWRRVPARLRRGVLEPLLRAAPDGGTTLLGRAQRYVRRAGLPNPRRFYSYEFLVAQQADRLLVPEFAALVDREAPWRLVEAHFERAACRSELNRLLYLDLKLTIGDGDLYKVTRTAEIAGVGVRFPLLDHPLAEATGRLPARYKVRGLEKRYLFKRAFADLLPREVLWKRKHGFGVPVSVWLRDHRGFRDLAHDALRAPDARTRRYVRPDALEDLFRRHAADVTPYYGTILWTLLMLELWHRAHAEPRA